MSTNNTSSLFLLIQGMSKNEKRHFKLYAHSHSPNKTAINYLELFDIIAKQEDYDEDKIIKQNIVKKEHLRMLKNYLYNLILESLRVLRSNRNDIDSQLNNLIESALIMREKGIAKEELKLWEKARELAFQHERWGPALHVLLMQSEKMTRDMNVAGLKKIEEEIQEVNKKVNNLFEYKKLRREILNMLMRLDLQKSVRNRQELQKVLNNPLIKNEKNGLSAAAIKEGFFTRLLSMYAIGDFEGTLRELKRALAFIESAYSKLDFPEYHHAAVLSNLSARQMETGRFKEAIVNIEKHKNVQTRSITARDYIFIFSHLNETNYYLATGEYEKGMLAIRGMEEQIKAFKSLIHYPSVYVIYFNAAGIFFGACEYEKALHWIRKITNSPAGACGEDIRAWAHIVMILTHFEMKTPDILEHLTSATHRFMNKRARLYKVEESILKFMFRLNNQNFDKKTLQKEFTNFYDTLAQITKDPAEAKALMYFDLNSWLESKIQNRPLSEIVKEKLKQPT